MVYKDNMIFVIVLLEGLIESFCIHVFLIFFVLITIGKNP